MLKQINTGEPFNCTYCKKNSEFTEFVQIKKAVAEKKTEAMTMHLDKRRRREATSYESLLPFFMQSGGIQELYTRAIVIFNNEEVIL